MRKNSIRKYLVIGVIILFFGASIAPNIVGNVKKLKNTAGYTNDNSTIIEPCKFIKKRGSICEAVDNCNLTWMTGGDADWFGQENVSYYDGDAAQSGDIGDGGYAEISASVVGPGILEFYWKVSSEETFDLLGFYIDGIWQTGISGEVDWRYESYNISAGIYELKWNYEKDGIVSNGSDCGWLDYVSFTNLPPGNPDLIVTDVWNVADVVYYQIRNIGGGIASGSHYTSLFVNGSYIINDLVTADLHAGDRLSGFFNYSWNCTLLNDSIEVQADYFNNVTESNETNNSRREIWKCDVIPPIITYGPIIQDISQNYTVIYWETNEASNSTVRYSKISAIYDFKEKNDSTVWNHSISLTNLDPSTTYHFKAVSTDLSDNTVLSKDILFETLSLPDNTKPNVSIIDPGNYSGFVKLSANASDNMGVEKVEFYIDDDIVYTDYSYPYELPLDTTKYSNGEYDFSAKVIDLYGLTGIDIKAIELYNFDDPNKPVVEITSHNENEEVSEDEEVIISLKDEDPGLFFGCFYVDGKPVIPWIPDLFGTNEEIVKINWNTRGWKNGDYTIAFEAFDKNNNKGFDTVDIVVNNYVPPTPPDLDIIREVTRTDNYFTVKLNVKNVGGSEARNIRIVEYLQLFQPISDDTNWATYKTATQAPDKTEVARISIISKVNIPSGDSQIYSYHVIPVLMSPILDIHPIIGVKPTVCLYKSPGGDKYRENFAMPSIQTNAFDEALKSSIYLIVTDPCNLLLFNPKQDVDTLLSTMAELAYYKLGSLAYIKVPPTFNRNYEKHDGFAVGDVRFGRFGGDVKDEIVIGDRDKDDIFVYKSDGDHIKTFDCGLNKAGNIRDGFQGGDKIAIGQIMNGINSENEIVMADRDDWIIFYCSHGNELDKFKFDFEGGDDNIPGDCLAVGNVYGNSYDEIIIADISDNKIWIYSGMGTYINDFENKFQRYDLLTVGDVMNDDKEEIIIADRKTNKIYIYDYSGNELSKILLKSKDFEDGDGLAAGNVMGNEKDEIIIGDGGDYIDIYNGYRWIKRIDVYNFRKYDGLATGNVIEDSRDPGGPYDEILVANRFDDTIDIYGANRYLGDNKYKLRSLIEKGGLWSNKLNSKWNDDGNLLIVGEIDIVPAYSTYHSATTQDTEHVLTTDLLYANTVGSWLYPELNVGRIIGNTAKNLIIPIRTSIGEHLGLPGYNFDTSNAMVVSGGGGGSWGFLYDTKAISDRLDAASFTVRKLYYLCTENPDVLVPAPPYPGKWMFKIQKLFLDNVADNDVICYRDHGNAYRWGWGGGQGAVVTSKDTLDFGGTKPFTFALCCSAGSYRDKSHDNIYGIAEHFLENGAGVYIGATTDSKGIANSDGGRYFFDKWPKNPSIGHCLKEVKRKMANGGMTWIDDYKKNMWVSQYQLYGDPCYGMKPSLGQLDLNQDIIERNFSSINIHIPNYCINITGDGDYIHIPGGLTLGEPNKPLLPYYPVFIDFPKYYRIQNIELTNRSNLVNDTGLNIPICDINKANNGEIRASRNEGEDWWPDKEFTWTVIENGNDTITLKIAIYPFYYNPLTTDVRFYKNYSFNVNYTVSQVDITKLELDSYVYKQGDTIIADIEFNNSAEPQDVSVSAFIKLSASDEIINGLLLSTLSNFSGLASYSPQWNSSGFNPGDYLIEVILKDINGSILDQKIEEFRLGISSGEITNFTATPEYFDIGDNIKINMTFNNTGTVNITGAAYITIHNSTGYVIEEFNHTIINLTTSESISFNDIWDTSEAEEGAYNIVSYVLYDSESTLPSTIIVNTNHPPLIYSEYPIDGKTKISIALSNINVTIVDPEGDTLNWSIETSPNIGNNSHPNDSNGSKTCNVSGLKCSTTYEWYVNVTDGKDWTRKAFTFTTNYAPDVSNVNPANGSIVINLTPICNITVSDLDGDKLTVFWYENTTGKWVLQQINKSVPANTSCVWDNYNNASSFNTTYFWKVKVNDSQNCFTEKIYQFTTRVNNPPNTPSSPYPSNGATDVDINADLSWNCSDPDEDNLTYNVYFKKNDSTPDDLVSENQTNPFYDPGTMEYGTTYYWMIVAWDQYGTSTKGLIWNFTTGYGVPDINCQGELVWTSVKSGSTVNGSFTISNNGDTYSELDWRVESYPEWGNWDFIPNSGINLKPEDGDVKIEVTVVAPKRVSHQKIQGEQLDETFTGEIKIINTENNSDFCIIDVSMTVPMSYQINFHFFLYKIFQLSLNTFPLQK